MENKSEDEYRVKDLGEAAALLCKSVKLLGLQKDNNFYWFIFSDKETCDEISNRYWFGELLVNAKLYQDALRTLKDRLFAQR